MGFFEILNKDIGSAARTGTITTKTGTFKTPVFMPVGTKASVKAVTQHQLREIGFEIILGNLFHLYLQPGIEVIKKAGGLHSFMDWNKNILTDSGGFQVFSLDKMRKVTDAGVEFKSMVDGSKHFFTPDDVINMQFCLDSDIIMVLDECIPFTESLNYTKNAAERTLKWAEISIKTFNKLKSIKEKGNHMPLMFGIVQGGFIKEIRRFCAESISQMDFNGIAIGGLSVGEKKSATNEILQYTTGFVDKNRPLYLMGLGDPVGILDSIAYGVDMFDCVLPTRISRMGSAYTQYGKINIKNRKYTDDFSPLDEGCRCYACRHHTKAYIKHLYKSKEILAAVLLTIHNLTFINSLIESSRKAIEKRRFEDFRKAFKEKYRSNSH